MFGIKELSGKLVLGGESKLKASSGIETGNRMWIPPVSVREIKMHDFEDCISNCNKKMLVCVFVAPWDPQTAHASRAAQIKWNIK